MSNSRAHPAWSFIVPVLWLGLFGVAQTAAAELGYHLSPAASATLGTPSFWPPWGLLVGGLLLTRGRYWAGFLAATLAGILLSQSWLHQESVAIPLAMWLGNSVGALTGAWLFRKWLGPQASLNDLKEVVGFLALPTLLGSALSAVVTAVALQLSGVTEGWETQGLERWMGALTSVLAFAPPLFLIGEFHTLAWSWTRAGEAGLLLSVYALCTHIFSGQAHGFVGVALIVPGLLWATLRFGQLGGACALLLTGLLMLENVASNRGLIASAARSLEYRFALAGIFFGIFAATFLVLGAALREKLMVTRRHQQQLTLLQAVIESTTDAIFIKDREGRYLLANAAALRWMGRSAAEALGRTDLEIFPAEVAHSIRAVDQEILCSGQSQTLEEPLPHLGEIHVFQTTKSPFRDTEGNLLGVVGISRDITERRRADEALRRSEERYRSLVELSPDTILILQDGIIVYANEASLALFGATCYADLLGRRALDFIHPDEQRTYLWRTRTILEARQRVPPYHYRIQRLDGVWIDVESRAGPCKHQGQPAIQVVGQDITQRVRAEQALRESEAQLRMLLDQFPAILWSVDVNLQITNSLGAGLKRVGLHPGEVVGLSLLDYLARDEHPEQTLAFHRRALAGESFRFETSQRGVAYEGQYEPLRNRQGQIIGCLALALDVTERKRAEREQSELRDRYQRLFDNAVVGIFQSTPEGKYLAANPALAHLLGYQSPEEVLNSIRDIGQQAYANPERRREFRQLIESAGQVHGFETEGVRRDGTHFWSQQYARVVRDSSGAILYYEGFIQDITDRKKAEEEKQRLAFLVEHSSDFIAMCDLEGRPTYCNKAGLQTIGLAGAEALQTFRVWDCFFPEDRAFVTREFFPRVLREGAAEVEIRFRHFQTGEAIWMTYNVLVLRDALGQPNGFATISRNITERRRTEEVLSLHSQILAHLMEGVLLVRTSDWVIVYANPTLEKMFGYGPDELLGQKVSSLNASGEKSSAEVAQKIIDTLRATGEWSGMVRNVRRDGTPFWSSIRITTFEHPLHGQVWVGLHQVLPERGREEGQPTGVDLMITGNHIGEPANVPSRPLPEGNHSWPDEANE